MKPDFERALREAARLTQAGRLADATATLQAALGGVRPSPPTPPTPPAPESDVIDIEARVIPEPRTGSPAPAPDAAPVEAFLAGEFANRAGQRAYKLYVPPAAGPRPLVVMLHGCTQDPDDFARGTRMNLLARDHGALVLYPAQSRQANPQGCWNWFKHNHQARDRGEPGVLAGMVREVIGRHDADPSRVYVAGLSAGGAMAAILGDTCPDLFAAVGVHSGLAAGSARDLPSALAAMQSGGPPAPRAATPLPTIVFHGDGDGTVHAANGERVAQAAGALGAGEQRRGETHGRRWTRQAFDQGRIERWILHGAGHAWSGGSPAGSYADAGGPDASAEMLRFFLAHPKG